MKLPVAFTLGNREASLDKDPLMRNALAEPDKEAGVVKARKRPALNDAYTITTGIGQGLFTWTIADPDGDDDDVLVGISDDVLNTAPTPINKTLRFVVQPSDADLAIGEVISPAVTVEAIDLAGNRVTSYTGAVAISLSTNPTSATLGGDTSNNAVSGLATFNDLELDRSGSGFKLGASASGLSSGTSDAFTIATQLAFTTQPAAGQPGETLDPIVVTAQDRDGNTDTGFTGEVTLSLYSATGAGVLSGTLTVDAVAGVASFSNVEVSAAGTYALLASCDEEGNNLEESYKPASSPSNSFSISDYILTSADLTDGGFTIYGFNTLVTAGIAVGGALSPDTFSSATIVGLNTTDFVGGITSISISGNRAQSFFTTISINGMSRASSSATYQYNAGLDASIWQWTSSNLITGTGTYAVSIA